MKTRLAQIGNSKGVRIAKPLLEQAGLSDEVVITVEKEGLLIRPARRAREGWAESFQRMAQRGDDAMIDDVAPSLSQWDEDEWKW